jgi:hypothetical protein
METLLSTDLTFTGILLRVLVILAIWGIIYLYNACKNAPVVPNDKTKK